MLQLYTANTQWKEDKCAFCFIKIRTHVASHSATLDELVLNLVVSCFIFFQTSWYMYSYLLNCSLICLKCLITALLWKISHLKILINQIYHLIPFNPIGVSIHPVTVYLFFQHFFLTILNINFNFRST